MQQELRFTPVTSDVDSCKEGGRHEIVYMGKTRDQYGRMRSTKTYKCSKCGEYITKAQLGVENA